METESVRAEPLVIRMEGVFDVRAAERLLDALADTGDAEIRIDLSKVREFHDFGVVVLVRALEGRARTSVLGLRQHHVRLLRHLGIEAGRTDLGAYAELA